MTAPLFDEKEDWTFSKLDSVYEEIEKIAVGELKLDIYPNQVEMICAEQMLDAYSSNGLPVHYRHWSLGKSFVSNERAYSSGQTSLAYEIVLNCSPCISFLQDSNDMTMQALVIAHACFGHNAFFKGNDEFRRWTRAESAIDEMDAAKRFIAKCEERYGAAEVESVLDACHALMDHGVDTVLRPSVPSWKNNQDEAAARKGQRETEEYNLLWTKTVNESDSAMRHGQGGNVAPSSGSLPQPEENILYFMEKNAVWLPPWKREVIRIVRKLAQYFYPQGLTKTANEGLASYTHYFCMNRLHEKGLITDGAWFNFIRSHTNVVMQPDFDDPRYSGINPYALGFAIYRDIERVCTNPTAEDREYLPGIVGMHPVDALHEAFEHHNDASFISQFLSPKVTRDLRLFVLDDPDGSREYTVESVCDERGFPLIRALLSERHTRSYRTPRIEVVAADIYGDRTLTLRHTPYRDRPVEPRSSVSTLDMAESLWGYKVVMETPSEPPLTAP